MNRNEMLNRVAENILQLDQDGVTIQDGSVTELGMNNRIDFAWREILFPVLSDKYPSDFNQLTYPINTYTATASVSSLTSGVDLYANINVFDNSMEGITIQNPTRGSSLKIVTYIAPNHVVMESSVTTALWATGDTFYVLGNEFVLNGDAIDMKEVSYVGVKYTTSDLFFRTAKRGDLREMRKVGNETFSVGSPRWYWTSIDTAEGRMPAIGILPFPTSYQGQLQIEGPEKPIALTANGEPLLINAGIANVIINDVTAWAWKIKGDFIKAQQYEEVDPRTRIVYPRGLRALILSYHPKSRGGPLRLKKPIQFRSMKTRRS